MRRLAIPTVLALLSGCTPEGRLVFEHSWVLWAGAAALVLVAWRWWRTPGASLAHSRVDDLRRTPVPLRARIAWLPRTLRLVALALIIVACARPQAESANTDVVEGIDLFLVLDMSGSMMAVDMTPNEVRAFQVRQRAEPPNRFEYAVATLQEFVSQRERDRIGTVVFAEDAYLQFPLTLDYATIHAMLDELEIDTARANGTAIGNALGVATRGLLDSTASSRAIILITDGKRQGGNISPMEAAALARDEGIRVFPILVGRDGPTQVPSGRMLRDGTRQYVQQSFPVDPDLLRGIADESSGAFFRAADRQELERDLNEILDRLERSRLEDLSSVHREELFARFALAALLGLLAEAVVAWLVIRRFP